MKRLIAFVLIVLLFVCSAMAEPTEKPEIMFAEDYIELFLSAELPIENIMIYTEENDPNNRLGRPGEYSSKANFADSRIEQFDEDDPEGGTIEVFDTNADLLSRKKYLESVFEQYPQFKMYIFVSDDGLALLRLSYGLTPKQAEEYSSLILKED